MATSRTNQGERASLLIAAAVLASMWVVFGSFSIDMARSHDFLNIYTGAALARDGRWTELHDIETQLAVERRFVPSEQPLVPFVRPHFYALVLAPLALLPFGVAFWAWLALQTGLYCGFGYWALRRFGEEGLFYWSLFLPGALSIAHGQDAPAVLAILLAGFVLSERGKPFSAGLVWSLALMKFHLCFGLVAALALSRRWRLLQGIAAGGAALGGLSVALAGPEGVRNYISMLTNSNLERLSPAPVRMTNIQGILANLGLNGGAVQFLVALSLGSIVFLLLVRASLRADLWRVLAAGLSGGMLLAPHVYLYDLTALLLPLLIGIQSGQRMAVRCSALVLIVPLAPLMALAGPPVSAIPALALLAFLATLALPPQAEIQAMPSAGRGDV